MIISLVKIIVKSDFVLIHMFRQHGQIGAGMTSLVADCAVFTATGQQKTVGANKLYRRINAIVLF